MSGPPVRSELTNLSRIKEHHTDSPWPGQVKVKARSVFLSLPLFMGIEMRFLWENVLKVSSSGQSDVRSGTSMTTCCVVNANMDSGDLGKLG